MPASNSTGERPTMDSRWNEIRSAIRVRWPEISAEDLRNMDGDSRKLVALVNQKTSMPLHEIEAAIDELAESSGGLLTRLANTAQVMAGDAARRVSEPMAKATRSAGEMISECPASSVATVFGAGFLVGLGLALLTAPAPARSSSMLPWRS